MMELSTDIQGVNLTINKVSREIYDYLRTSGEIHEDELYCVEETNLDAKGQRLLCVAFPELESDGVNKNYVDGRCYSKNETSSSNQISSAFENNRTLLRVWSI